MNKVCSFLSLSFCFALIFFGAATTAGIGAPASDLGQMRRPAGNRTAPIIEEGFVSTTDGTRLFYQRAGRGPKTIIVPGRLLLFEHLKPLANRYTVISYDMRNRGRSDTVLDGSKISIQHDVRDLETIRQYFEVKKFGLVGYSYLGMMVMLYAAEHPQHVERIVQLGPVPLIFPTEYPANLTYSGNAGADAAAKQRVKDLQEQGADTTKPKEFCEAKWAVDRFNLVGKPENVSKVGEGRCDMPNEWPLNFRRHLEHHFGSIQKLKNSWEAFANVRQAVLTIHGTRDRNAPYGAGREWAAKLSNARLLTVEDAAHQSFAEYPEIVLPALRTFFGGRWPRRTEVIKATGVSCTRDGMPPGSGSASYRHPIRVPLPDIVQCQGFVGSNPVTLISTQSTPAGSNMKFPVKPEVFIDRFRSAEGITFNGEGHLFIGANNGIWLAEPDGAVRKIADVDRHLGQAGIGSRDILAADFGPTNVFEHGPNTDGIVWRVTPEGEKTVVASGIADPNAIVVLPDRTFLVSDDGTDKIYKVKGNSVSIWSTDVAYPNGLALSPDDRVLYVAQIFSSLKPIVADDRIWAFNLVKGMPASTPRVVARTREGGLDGLVTDELGRVYVADNGAGKIQRLDPKTGELVLIAEGMPGIASLVFGEGKFDHNAIYATSTRTGRIWKVRVGVKGARLHR